MNATAEFTATIPMSAAETPATGQTAANRSRLQRAEATLAEMLAAALRRGFYGSCALELSINDGTIQHIRRRVEQIERT